MSYRSVLAAFPGLVTAIGVLAACSPGGDDNPGDAAGEDGRADDAGGSDADADAPPIEGIAEDGGADGAGEAGDDGGGEADDGSVAPGFHERTRVVIGSGFHPRFGADRSGRLHLGYHDGSQIFYRAFSTAWSEAEVVPGSNGVSASKATRHRMWVSADGDRVYVSWGTGWDTDIRFAGRDGAGWHGPETACARTLRPWEYAAVAGRSTGDAYVFCMVDDLWVARRSPAGTWDAPVNVWTGASKHVAAVTSTDDEIHATFRFARVYYFHGDGGTWSGIDQVTVHGDSAEVPAIAVDGAGTVHLAWQRWLGSGSDWAIESVRYANGGDDTWTGGGPGVTVHMYAAPANPPEVAVDGRGRVFVAWVEGTEVLLAVSVDGGETFPEPFVVASDPAEVRAGSLENDLATPPTVVVGDDVHVVYENSSRQLVHVVGTVTP